jgi:hypothetical protein
MMRTSSHNKVIGSNDGGDRKVHSALWWSDWHWACCWRNSE